MTDRPGSETLPEHTQRWVASTLDADVLRVERFTRARQAWWVDVRRQDGQPDAGERRWMLKGRRAPAAVIARSRLLSEFGPQREVAAMRALAGTPVLVPRVGGFDPASSSLLVEQVAGSALLQRADRAQRLSVIRHYAGQLAELHSLSWQNLPIDQAIPVPEDAEQMAVGGWLRAAEADADTAEPRLRHAEPLHDLARWWLHHHRPDGRGLERMRLLHGDAGVNNFLFAEGRVTALIDWELSIIGDPMSDLGNARYREALYPTGTYPQLLVAYEQAGGQPLDRSAISYYTVLAAITLSLGMVANVQNPRPSQPEVVARLWQDAVARCVACEAMAEASGVRLGYDEQLPVASSSFDPLAGLLAARLESQTALEAGTQAAAEAHGYARLAEVLQRVVVSGPGVDALLIEDAASLLGYRPRSVDSALGELAGVIRAGKVGGDAGGFDFEAILVVLARDARRRLELLRPLQRAEVWEDAAPVVGSDTGGPADAVLPDWEPA